MFTVDKMYSSPLIRLKLFFWLFFFLIHSKPNFSGVRLMLTQEGPKGLEENPTLT